MTQRTSGIFRGGLLAVHLGCAAPGALMAQTVETASGTLLNTYGMPGLLDMPSALTMPDAELATTIAAIDGLTRSTLAFQITPRLTGAFRYTILEDYGATGKSLYDRSFDLHYRFLNEGTWRPAMAVGLRDLAGTSVYSAEYLVATKHLTPRLAFSGGFGWGRLGSFGSFDNPLGALDGSFDTRPASKDEGGQPNVDQWFHGPAALFAGAQWQATDKLALKLEYSSDAYEREEGRGLIDRESPFNFGLSYGWLPGVTLGAQYLHGSELGLTVNFTLNPRKSPLGGDHSPAPFPVVVRSGAADSWDGAILEDPAQRAALADLLAQALAAEGLVLERLELSPDHARLRLRNTRFDNPPQALGRTARILTAILPPSVERFEIEPSVEGMGVARVTLMRSDIERLEYAPDGIAQSWAAAQIGPAGAAPEMVVEPLPRFSWGLGPYLATSFFDPDDPLRADAGVELQAQYHLTHNLSLSGAVRAKVIGNRDDATRVSDSVLPHVRSDANLYARNGKTGVEYLTLDHFSHPARDLYARLSLGYLEEMYGGVSGEVLWKPVESRLALGLEMNYVQQRDTDKLFGFDEYDYDVVTGHASAYYDLTNGFEVQVDAGRYLAGDWGATLSLDRTFDNGWKVGAFATLTDVSSEDFGEGSFDKGLRLTIPQSWFMGQPSQRRDTAVIRPLQRDGGARLNVRNRLYEQVRDYHAPELDDQWGRFWR
ncbi:YjbH domain-containing protein [Actibacterium sp. D379-3]